MATPEAPNKPTLASFSFTCFAGVPIKLYAWESWEKNAGSTNSEKKFFRAYCRTNYSAPEVAYFRQFMNTAKFHNQINIIDFKNKHEDGWAFLYSCKNDAGKVVLGLEVFTHRKVENWPDNPMVDSWAFEITPQRLIVGKALNSIPRERGVECNAEVRISGREADLRAVSRSKKEYVYAIPAIPIDLLGVKMCKRMAAPTKILG